MSTKQKKKSKQSIKTLKITTPEKKLKQSKKKQNLPIHISTHWEETIQGHHQSITQL